MKGNLIFIAFAVFTVSLIITINFFLQQNYQAEMAGQFNKQQLLLAKSVSNNIRIYIEHLENETLALSTLLAERKLDSPLLTGFVDDVFSEIKSETGIDLKVYSRDGKLVYSNPPSAPDGDDRPVLERTLTNSSGGIIFHDISSDKRVVRLATSIPGPSGPKGAIVLNLYMDTINEKFLAPLKSGQKGYAWMMDRDGTLLFHPTQPDMVGKNLHSTDPRCLECHRGFETEKWILKSGESGASSYSPPLGEDKLIAFSKLNIFDTQWIICVSIPYSEITASIRKSMKLHSTLVIVIVIAATGGAFTIIVVNTKRIKAEHDARHREDLKKYAGELEHVVQGRTRELTTEKDKLNTILNAIGGGLLLMDTEGKVVWANMNVTDMAGRDLTGTESKDLFPGRNVVSTLTDDRLETNIVKGLFDAPESYFQVTTAPVKSDGEITGFLQLIHDVTEMKMAEERMSHSEKLASMGRLTAGIAHEIGNPLTSVFSFLQILKENETDKSKKENLDTIMFHITRIAHIVRQLSGLSKVPPSEFNVLSVNAVVESSLDLIRYDRRSKYIDIRSELDPDLPKVLTDGNQLSQVFVNLTLNAVDSMPGGGTLCIRSSRRGEYIYVEFKDTGSGITAENLDRVFDPFFTTKDKGTGLGLSVSLGIIKRLKGDLTVKSEPGKGTSFTASIPIKAVHDEG